MALFDTYTKKSILKAAIKQTAKARTNEGAKADQLFISAYDGFANVVKDDLIKGEALYNWGFALLHQAKSRDAESAVKPYLDAISKFTFCLLVSPNHLGAAIDGGVAYMDLARIMGVEANDELYDLAKEFFDDAERIQRGSAAYNLACICGIQKQEEACIEALDLSKEYGSLPRAEDIANDEDLLNVRNCAWFVEFMESVIAGPEPEIIDKNIVVYDEEGKIVREETKDMRKNPEQEVDGVVYDIEGNVLRRVGEENVDEVTEETIETNAEADVQVAEADVTDSLKSEPEIKAANIESEKT